MGRVILMHRPETWDAPEPPVNPELTLDGTSRAFLAVTEALWPWSDSVLVAAYFHTSDADVRASILSELELRKDRR